MISTICVVDASVAGKWYLQDELAIAEAEKIQGLGLTGKWRLIAPALLLYELPNLLLKAVKDQRLKPDRLVDAINDFVAKPIDFYSYDARSSTAIARIATSYGLTFYDASYVALAQATGAVLANADRKMQGAAEAMGLLTSPIGI